MVLLPTFKETHQAQTYLGFIINIISKDELKFKMLTKLVTLLLIRGMILLIVGITIITATGILHLLRRWRSGTATNIPFVLERIGDLIN